MTIRVIRARSEGAVDYIEHLLTPDYDQEVEQVANQLRGELTNYPRDTFLDLLIDEDEDKCVGFMYAIAPGGRNHTLVVQAFAEAGLDSKFVSQVFVHLTWWTRAIGRSVIQTEAARSIRTFIDKWDFEPYATILSYQIPDELESDFIDNLMEQKNGRIIRKRGDEKHTTRDGQEAHNGGDGPHSGGSTSQNEVARQQDRDGNGSIRGSSSSSSTARDAGSEESVSSVSTGTV